MTKKQLLAFILEKLHDREIVIAHLIHHRVCFICGNTIKALSTSGCCMGCYSDMQPITKTWISGFEINKFQEEQIEAILLACEEHLERKSQAIMKENQ